jgi:RNA polymerase sigma-70 factor (ECF subfamily)
VEGTTLWSRVLAAADPAHPERREALEFLAVTYWRPVYHLFRRLGARADEAPDLTQEFFARLIDGPVLAAADPDRGRFRAYLRTAARNFLLHEWEKKSALKRGGGVRRFDFDVAERVFVPRADPDRDFDRQWAIDLLQACLVQLESELRGPLFDALRTAFSLDGAPQVPTHARIAAGLGVAEPEVTKFLFNARRRLREILRERVRASVASEADVDAEIRDLFSALS